MDSTSISPPPGTVPVADHIANHCYDTETTNLQQQPEGGIAAVSSTDSNSLIPSSIPPSDNVRVFDLEQPRTTDMPIHGSHKPGYYYALHRRHSDTYDPHAKGSRSSASGMIMCMEHSGTHIDALCHQAEHMILCGGVSVEDVERFGGFSKHAIEDVPPIVGPAILLDMPRYLGIDCLDLNYLISLDEIRECCEQQGVRINAGDTVLVRTGNAQRWSDEAAYLAGPGVEGKASEWLADQGVIAVGADNMAWDVIGQFDEAYGCEQPGHVILLARKGVYIIENLNLEHLAAAGHWRFEFICLPLKFVGATGSPVRPIAIIQD
jgi:kynurenine formamidase